MITTSLRPPGRSSSGRKPRPSSGGTPSTRRNSCDTSMPGEPFGRAVAAQVVADAVRSGRAPSNCVWCVAPVEVGAARRVVRAAVVERLVHERRGDRARDTAAAAAARRRARCRWRCWRRCRCASVRIATVANPGFRRSSRMPIAASLPELARTADPRGACARGRRRCRASAATRGSRRSNSRAAWARASASPRPDRRQLLGAHVDVERDLIVDVGPHLRTRPR